MPRQITIVLTCFLFCSLAGWSQNITVINQFGDTTGLGNDVSFSLARSQQHTLIINYYEPATGEEVQRLEQLIGSALDYYVDHAVEIKGDKVVFRKGQNTAQKEMEQIVKDAIKYYDYKEISAFKGFSDAVENKLDEIVNLDLSKGDWNQVEDSEKQAQFKYYFVQKHLNDLKLMANTEIGNFSNDNLMVVEATELETLDPESQARLLEEINNFQTHDPLSPLELELGDATVTLLASDDEFALPIYRGEQGSDDFAEKVYEMLVQNNSKLDNLQSEIDDIRRQQEEDRIAAQEMANSNMQRQIDELRDMIVELVSDRKSELPASTKPTAIANLPSNVEIGFSKGSIAINGASQFVLSEVIDILARNPGLKIMVTGYADKTGDAQANLLLSQKRARSVRNFVMKSGLSSDRIVMNYFGDKDSQGENPSDRKVVIEFLQY